MLAGLSGMLPLALPFGLAYPSGWAAIRYFVGAAADPLGAIGVGLVALTGAVLTCLGTVLLVPRSRDRVRARAIGRIAIVLGLIGVGPAAWFAVASDFRLGGMAIGTYSFLLSGVIGLTGALPALFGRDRPEQGRVADSFSGQSPARTGSRYSSGDAVRLRDHDETPWGLR